MVIFVISVNKKYPYNKVDMKPYSQYPNENEILLMPYLNFIVTGKEPLKKIIKGIEKTICKIYIEELTCDLKDIDIVWFDPTVNLQQNLEYQEIIKGINKNLFVLMKLRLLLIF